MGLTGNSKSQIEWDFDLVLNQISEWLIRAKEQGYSPIGVEPLQKNNIHFIAVRLLETSKLQMGDTVK